MCKEASVKAANSISIYDIMIDDTVLGQRDNGATDSLVERKSKMHLIRKVSTKCVLDTSAEP